MTVVPYGRNRARRSLQCEFCGKHATWGVRRGMNVEAPSLFMPVCLRCRNEFRDMPDMAAIDKQTDRLIHMKHPSWMMAKQKHGGG